MLKYEIIINPKLLRKMNKDIWEDELVSAELRIGDNRYNIKISYRGDITRDKKKKSYRIVFDKPALVNGAHELHLNAEFADVSLCRNKMSLDFFDQIGVIAPHSKHVLLYINGMCKGIYLEIESFDQFLLKKRNLPDGTIIYAAHNKANFSLYSKKKELKSRLSQGYEVKYGRREDLFELEQFIAMVNTLSNDDFEKEIPKALDIDKYLKWVAGAVCTQNYDGFIHNYALYKNGETQRYEITPWDYDGTWGRNISGDLQRYDKVPFTGYNTLTGRLLHLAPFKKKYKEILENILENDFTVTVQEPKINELFEVLKPHLGFDPYIKTTAETLEQEKDVFFEFIKKRNEYIKEQLLTFV